MLTTATEVTPVPTPQYAPRAELEIPPSISAVTTLVSLAVAEEQAGRDAIGRVLLAQATEAASRLDVSDLVDGAIDLYDRGETDAGHLVMELAAAAAARLRDTGRAGWGVHVEGVAA